MYKIVDYKHLGGATHELVVEAPQLAKKARAGQFLIVRILRTTTLRRALLPLLFKHWGILLSKLLHFARVMDLQMW